MLTTLALVAATTINVSNPTPQCEYYRYLSGSVWSALDDAERHGASRFTTMNLETTLRDTAAKERKACGN